MQINVYKDYSTLSFYAAKQIIELVKVKPEAVLCLAAGDTPKLTYALMVQMMHYEKADFSGCTFIGLDEWVGIPPENEGSCHFFLQQYICQPLNILSSNIHLFDALSDDLEQECRTMNSLVASLGGIDLMVVGVGMNGHIGFNEPGVPADTHAHVIQLDTATQTVGQKYFKKNTRLEKGITLGLGHLQEAKKVILIANGKHKAEIIKKVLEEEINTDLPASIVRTHRQALVMLDKDAASLVNGKGFVVNEVL